MITRVPCPSITNLIGFLQPLIDLVDAARDREGLRSARGGRIWALPVKIAPPAAAGAGAGRLRAGPPG